MSTEKVVTADHPHIAIVVPVYNPGKYKLTQCIRSILAQTYRAFTLVLVDDGSTDDSGQVCDYFAQKDSRVKVIHQANQGSLAARQTGVFSNEAQSAEYICFCDSDDSMLKDALEKLAAAAEQAQADCVCGNMRRIYRGITLPNRFVPPCFSISAPKVYSNQAILSELYISCFGISNYPVSLFAKLYRKELITQAFDFAPLVKFMGEDLSLTLRLLPETQKLVIIPDIVYNYRIGGGTSKFMPDMLNDFLSLYHFKQEMAQRHPMPQNSEYLMAVELKNIVLTWLEMIALKENNNKQVLHKEIIRVCRLPEIQAAMQQKDFVEREASGIRKAIQEINTDYIEDFLAKRIAAERVRRIIKKFLK